MDPIGSQKLHELGIGATVRFACGTVSMYDIDSNGNPLAAWRLMHPDTTSTPLGPVGYVVEGRIAEYDADGYGVTIRVTRVVAQGRNARPPKVGENQDGGWSRFFLP